MKKTLFLFLLTFQVLAATSGTLLLQGTIPDDLSLVVVPETNVHDNLDLTQDQTDLKVATVEEYSNSPTGFEILIQSQNSGELVNGTNSLPYTLKYDGVGVTLTSGNQVQAKSSATSSIHDYDSDVTISYTSQSLPSGTYEDTLTFTIQAN